MICRERANRRMHHPIGRDHENQYIDPDLVMELCHDHHMLCHDDWHTLELVGIDHRLTLIERVELRLRRIAAALSRIDMGQDGGTLWGSSPQPWWSGRTTSEGFGSTWTGWRPSGESTPASTRPILARRSEWSLSR